MVESVANTAGNVDLIAVVDEDDPEKKAYEEIGRNHKFVQLETSQQSMPFIKYFNSVFQQHSSYDYYSCTNDDFVYIRPSGTND